jgi:small-conductance mechanosensitive channel
MRGINGLAAAVVVIVAIRLVERLGPWALALPPVIGEGMDAVLWFAAGVFLVRLARLGLAHEFRRRQGRPPPGLLGDLIAFGLWAVLISTFSVVEFDVSPAAALATSGVMIAIIGFAIRSLVADLFYGVTMAVERPFEIGEWIGLSDGTTGRVEEMTWRAVKLTTKENLRVVVPNTRLAIEQIVNYDQPQSHWRNAQTLTLGYDVRPEQITEALASAVRQVPASDALPRPPEARIIGYNDRGVEWSLRYWVPSYYEDSEVGQQVHEALLRNLRFAGVRVPRRQEERLVRRLDQERAAEAEAATRWIDRVELFTPVPRPRRARLQANATRHELGPGEHVVDQGETGSSLFVIHRGAFDVLAEGAGTLERIGTLGPGAVFGELSLLTGAPRSATVRATTAATVFEITKAEVEPLLRELPDLAEQFATILADRQLADANRRAQTAPVDFEVERQGLIDRLVQGAHAFFKLSRP